MAAHNIQMLLEWLKQYDQQILKGLKTYLTIGVLFAAYFFMPVGKIQGFTMALGLVHLFVIRGVKS